ncbi:MAG: MFS transporter [Bacteroidota bacterium]
MKKILPIIVSAQFLCTSLWFAGNAINTDMARELQLDQHFLAHLTSAIQFGFIIGTLGFAIFTISDRFSPSIVFFCSAMLAGFFNLGLCLNNITATQILLFRFLTGFFLAGIYPVGMKIASDYYQSGLGKSLGFLVGALVLGTAFPHLLKDLSLGFHWKYVLYATTSLSAIGGFGIVLFVPNGPYRKAGQKIKLNAFANGFKKQKFRAVAFGYFGHMWELYSFWAFVPLMLMAYNKHYPAINLNVPLYSFLIIASGSLACVVSGIVSQFYGVQKIATISLILSVCCCILSPFFLFNSSTLFFLGFLFFWALVVIADSPLFSTLVAQNAPEESRGTSLTIVNCIGFSITVISIQLINLVSDSINAQFIYMILAIGPLLGLIGLRNKRKWH